MKYPPHLSLERIDLVPSTEWASDFPGWCFLRVSRGQGYWLGEAGPQEVNRGEVIALSPLREGVLRASQLAPVTLHYFRFAPDLLTGLLAPAERDTFDALAGQADCAARLLAADRPAALAFGGLCAPDWAGGPLMQRCDLLRIVATVFAAELRQPPPRETAFLSARRRLKLLMNQVPESEFLTFTPGEMAARCGCSLTHFNRSFMKLFNRSFRRKQQEIRLLRARQVLLGTTCRIESVAAEAGYGSVAEFNAAFKQLFGVTPSACRHPKSGKRAPHGPAQTRRLSRSQETSNQ